MNNLDVRDSESWKTITFVILVEKGGGEKVRVGVGNSGKVSLLFLEQRNIRIEDF